MRFSAVQNKIMFAMSSLEWSYANDIARASKTTSLIIRRRLLELEKRGAVKRMLHDHREVFNLTDGGRQFVAPQTVKLVTLSPAVKTMPHDQFMAQGRRAVVEALDDYMQFTMGTQMVSGVLDEDMQEVFDALEPILLKMKNRINSPTSEVQNSHLLQIGPK